MTKKPKLFRNCVIDKKQLKQIMSWAFTDFGIMKASYLANMLKDIGFHYATKAGLSISIEDLRVPPTKSNLVKIADKKGSQAQFEVDRGEITEVERFQKVINTWNITSESLKEQVVEYFRQTDPLNSIYMMAFSGARGNISQVRQLVGMRGLMADPHGEIIDLPIVNNFREGLTVTDYIISSYGARKGLVDTALRTADSGYLTRRLIDVAQDIITREKTCQTKDGIALTAVFDGNNTILSLEERLIGRVLASSIKDPKNHHELGEVNQEITPQLANQIKMLNLSKVLVKSPLTCASSRSVCQQCYGWNLAYGNLIDLGEAVGILAAQSIGEPGTQLTMRTFHTGGVFTSEPSRQIRAQFSGKIVFSKKLKIKKTRTLYGELAFLSENEASLTLVTFSNEHVIVKVLPETLILVNNNSFIKKNDILLERASTTRKTGEEKAFKYLSTTNSGEVLLEKEKGKELDFSYEIKFKKKSPCFLWILYGQVFNIPLNSKLQIKTQTFSRKNQSLAQLNVTCMKTGQVDFLPSKDKKENQEIRLKQAFQHLDSLPLYPEKRTNHTQHFCIYGPKNKRFILWSSSLSPFDSLTTAPLGVFIDTKYQTKTGGLFYSSDFKPSQLRKQKVKGKMKQVGGTIFYLPESTYYFSKEKALVYVENGDSIEAGQEIGSGYFSNIAGVVHIRENKKGEREVRIQPGRLLLLEKGKTSREYHHTIVYPGEILFDKIKITQVSFTEIKLIDGNLYLGIYPIVRYEIPMQENELSLLSKTSLRTNLDLSFGPLQINVKFGRKIRQTFPIQIIKKAILPPPFLEFKACSGSMDFVKKENQQGSFEIIFQLFEKLNLDNFLPNEIKKKDVSSIKIVQTQQFLEPYTNLASFQILIPEKYEITKIKQQFIGRERKVLLLTNYDYKKFHLEQSNLIFKDRKLIKVGEKLTTNILCKNSGFVSQRGGSTLTIHKGQPYLFSKGARIEKCPGDLIKRNESLGQLVYQRARTGDIVQGLPRVEEILEARTPKKEAALAIRSGIVTKIKYTSGQISLWIASNLATGRELKSYELEYPQRLLVGKFDFVKVGQPLTDDSMNPHQLLNIYFSYYRTIPVLTNYLAAYRSLRQIQAVLLNAVQAVYYSQGVNIADKHIEIILKQMTGKVEITESGDSPFRTEELVDLRQVFYVNNCLKQKETALFKPIILGITKASLKTNSFISAASFQHTKRILTEAAVQGRIDWLRGLKENVIIGRLIPAGTGFNAYSDISYLGVKIPSYLTKKEEFGSSTAKVKYHALKERVKFKIG